MPTSIEAQGHTVDEAIQIALNQLGVSRDKVEIEILHHPRRGVLGIGARRAKVRATIRESVMLDGEEFDMSGGAALDDKPRRRRRRGGRNRGGREDGAETTAESAPRPPAGGREPGRGEGEQRGARGRDGDGGRGRGDRRDDRRGGRGRGGERPAGQEGQPRGGQPQRGSQQRGQQGRPDQQRPQDQRPPDQRLQDQRGQDQRPQDQQRGSEPRRDGRDDSRDRQRGRQQGSRDQDRRDGGRGQRPEFTGEIASDVSLPRPESHAELSAPDRPVALPPARRQPAPEEPPLDAAALDAIRARAEELVRELLQKMGFAAEVSSSIDEAAGEAVVSVRSDSEGLLIGRRGQTLDSLEHIVNRMALRGDSFVEGRVLLDIGDYRKRRRESLDELATRLRARAVTERRTVQVSPMSPRDRKFFAQAFAGDDSVEVRALGAGFYRRVIVAPAGMVSAAVDAEVSGEGDDEGVETTEAGFAGTEAES